MDEIAVRHVEGDRFVADVRGHAVTFDQPVGAGGTDTAPTPTEVFVASVAACVAHYAHRYLVRHHLPTEGLATSASFVTADRPARVSQVAVSIVVPDGVPAERRDALLAVASHCTLHNTLEERPKVSVGFAA